MINVIRSIYLKWILRVEDRNRWFRVYGMYGRFEGWMKK